MNWYLKCWKQYADFSGRARRKEYWMFALFNGIIMFALVLFSTAVVWTTKQGGIFFGILQIAYLFAIIIPSLAVVVRRLHDMGRSGWWYLIGLVPLVGWIFLLVWLCTDSQPGENQWGKNPKELI